MATKIQLRRDTEANWDTNNPVLASGEIGIATDQDLFKIGNGIDAWNSLKYASAPMGTSATEGLSIGKDTSSRLDSVSVGFVAKSENASVSIGKSTTSDVDSISIGREATSEENSVSVGYGSTSGYGGISIGVSAKSSGWGINIGDPINTATDEVIRIGNKNHSTLKILAVAGATDGMTLKVNKDGTIYAE
ncbi:MAG TPA: hypothetical protein VFC79_07260 [Tissierellaceae bacterium]|nr:hypothetical protein [Tissierellaceae bacterium]